MKKCTLCGRKVVKSIYNITDKEALCPKCERGKRLYEVEESKKDNHNSINHINYIF